VKIHNSPLM